MSYTTTRRIEAAEWSTYKTLRLEALRESPKAFCANLQDNLQLTDTDWQKRLALASTELDRPLLALTDGQHSGIAWCTLANSRKTATIYQMWVAPEFRSQGVGQRLIKDMIDWSYASGALYVELEVLSGNPEAMALYRKTGFVEAGLPKLQDGNPPLEVQQMRINRFQAY